MLADMVTTHKRSRQALTNGHMGPAAAEGEATPMVGGAGGRWAGCRGGMGGWLVASLLLFTKLAPWEHASSPNDALTIFFSLMARREPMNGERSTA